jgi:hypothetical protein
MSVIILSSVAVTTGLVLAVSSSRRKVVAGAGAVFVCAGVAALIWSRPSTKRLQKQNDAIGFVCEGIRAQLVEFRGQQENEALRAQHPWAQEALVWRELSRMLTSVEPICFPDSGWPCIPERAAGLSPKTYDDVKPHLDRVIHALEAHTRCRAPLPNGSLFYSDDTSGFEPTK